MPLQFTYPPKEQHKIKLELLFSANLLSVCKSLHKPRQHTLGWHSLQKEEFTPILPGFVWWKGLEAHAVSPSSSHPTDPRKVSVIWNCWGRAWAHGVNLHRHKRTHRGKGTLQMDFTSDSWIPEQQIPPHHCNSLWALQRLHSFFFNSPFSP